MPLFSRARRLAPLFVLAAVAPFAATQIKARVFSQASSQPLMTPAFAAETVPASTRTVAAERDPAPRTGTWFARGTLLEACTCAVPCTCNFGEGPSPHSYCHATYAYKLENASYDGANLSGLVVGGVDAAGSGIGFLDECARPEQRAALQKLAAAVFAQGGPAPGARRFVTAQITHEIRGNALALQFKSSDATLQAQGGFAARLIAGRDGSPVVVENNPVWPIHRAFKGKTSALRYSDALGNRIQTANSNANYGAFRFSGDARAAKNAASTRGVKLAEKTSHGACCPPQKNGAAHHKTG